MSRIALAIPLLLAAVLAREASGAGLDAKVTDAAGNPVADAVVYAIPASGPAEAKPTRTAAIEQADREFVPYVSVVQAGTTVTFPNRDPILHHVYSFSPPKVFEIKLYTGKSPQQIHFDTPGVVTLGCNIHDWMIGYVLVVPTPHFGKADANGAVRLRDMSGGSYEFRAWHPQQRAPAAPQTMTLEGTAIAGARFQIDIAPRKPRYKPPLDRSRY
jgi:plastocyanin